MQAKTLIVVIILLSMFSILLTAGSKKEDVIEEMYGTWVNSLYNGRGYRNKRAKIIINSDGTIDKYNSEIDQSVRMTKPLKKSTVPNDTYSFYIEDSWIDQEKDSWYKVTCSNNLNDYGS
jgi:hypothetical protein